MTMMRSYNALAACLLLSLIGLIFVSSADSALELTTENFDTSLAKGTWFVKFYAPWCGHCQTLAPTWDQLAEKIQNDADFPDVHVVKVNCDDHAKICRDQGVRGYPTLILFHEGKKIAGYRQGRDLTSLVTFLKKNAKGRPSEGGAIELMGDNFDQQTLRVDERHFVMFYAPWCGHCQKLKPTWDKLAEQFKGTNVHVSKVDCTKENALCESYNVQGYPTLKLLVGDRVYDYSRGGRSLTELSDWVKEKKYEEQAHVSRPRNEPETTFLEKVQDNPQVLIAIMVGVIIFTLVMIGAILCCCADEEEEMKSMKAGGSKKRRQEETVSQDSSARTISAGNVSGEIRKRE